MAIQESDIKLFSALRPNDDADGGGAMAGVVVQDGVKNNLFPDVSSVDRGVGAFTLRKAFVAVTAAGADTLFDAHIVIDEPPADPAISAVLLPATSLADTRGDLIAALNTAQTGGDAYGFRGTVKLAAALNSGERVAQVESVRVPFLPMSEIATAVAGSVAPATVAGLASLAAPPIVAEGFIATSPILNGREFSAMLLTLDGQASMRVDLPLQSVSTVVTSANRAFVYSLPLPPGTVPGTESVTLQNSAGTIIYRSQLGSASMSPARSVSGVFAVALVNVPGVNSATVDRAAGRVNLVLSAVPNLDSEIVVSYAVGGQVVERAAGDLSNGGTVTAGSITVALPSGHRLMAATFHCGQVPLYLRGGLIRSRAELSEPIVGAYDETTGVLTLLNFTGQAITNFRAFSSPGTAGVSNIAATLPGAINAATLTVTGQTVAGVAFSATANAAGVFNSGGVSGQYSQTGALSVSFAAAVKPGSLAWSGSQITYTPSGFDLGGLNTANFPADGRVSVLRASMLVLLHHTDTLAAQAVTNGQTINVGRQRLARLRVIGNNGNTIASFRAGQAAPVGVGCSADLVAGTVSFSDVSGYSQPVRVEHRIEDLAALASASESGALRLNRPASHAYPAGAYVSSALQFGDLGARVHDGFALESWLDVWADVPPPGNSPEADFNQAANPITASDLGAITERWLFLFVNSTTFRVIGEEVGEIPGPWSTATVCAPINPATQAPYFSIPPAGWGGGWGGGMAFRLNTTGASGPFWTARITQPSDPFAGGDGLLLGLRGDPNS